MFGSVTSKFAAFLVCLLLTGNLAIAEDLFADKVLEAAVRRYVFEKRNSKEPLTEKDVENISTIEYKGHTYTLDGKKVERKKIKSLKGLEKCRSLALLDLENNEISDISPIKDLKIIQSLNLAKNKLTDISPVAGLVKVQYLQLENNGIVDIKPIAKLENMRSLYLSNNQIKDIKPISGLTKTWSLYLGGNEISDIKAVAMLKGLDTIDLRGNGLSDISPLSALQPSRFVFLQDNKISDIQVLVEMAQKDRQGENRFAPFWNVYLMGNPLSDMAKEKQMVELKKQSFDDRRPRAKQRIHF